MSYKQRSLENEKCGSSGCDNRAEKRVLFSLGFSACFCGKCADELVRNDIGLEQGYQDNYPEQDVNKQKIRESK